MKLGLIKLFACAALGVLSAPVFAAPLAISSYDMTGVVSNSYGYYDGDISEVGVSNYNYTGGSGTINGGEVALNYADAYLFYYSNAPTITLHLGEKGSVSFLELFSFENPNVNNAFVGSIAGVNVTINGETRFIATEGFGPANFDKSRDHIHERLNLVGSGLEDLITDTITLSGFVVDPVGYVGMYISLINVDGNPFSSGVVPEPAGLALLGIGFAGLCCVRRRKNAANARVK